MVAPVVGTLVAVIPFAYAALTDQAPSVLALAGALVAFIGLAVVAAGGRRAERVRNGLRWGAASGVCYGLGLSILIDAEESSGAWPVVSQRLVALMALAVVCGLTHTAIVPPRSVRFAAVIGGVCYGLASAFYLLGVHADAVPAVVTSSMFPAVSVTVGFFLFRDAITKIQVAGIGVVLAGVAGVVAG